MLFKTPENDKTTIKIKFDRLKKSRRLEFKTPMEIKLLTLLLLLLEELCMLLLMEEMLMMMMLLMIIIGWIVRIFSVIKSLF